MNALTQSLFLLFLLFLNATTALGAAQPDEGPAVIDNKHVKPVVFDPKGVDKAIKGVSQRHEEFLKVMDEMKSAKQRFEKDLPPLDKLNAEVAVLDICEKKVIPTLLLWRSEILANRAKLAEKQAAYADGLAAATTALERENAEIDRVIAGGKGGPTSIRSEKIKEGIRKLKMKNQELAGVYNRRSKAFQDSIVETDVYMTFVEDSGVFLEKWGNTIKAMRVVGVTGEQALAATEDLRNFANALNQGFDVFTRTSSNMEGPAAAAPPAKKDK